MQQKRVQLIRTITRKTAPVRSQLQNSRHENAHVAMKPYQKDFSKTDSLLALMKGKFYMTKSCSMMAKIINPMKNA